MNRIFALRRNHREIENYLLLLDEIMNEEILDKGLIIDNFENTLHLLKYCESKEKTLFNDFKLLGSFVPEKDLNKIEFLSKSIKCHMKALHKAFDSKNIAYIKLSLENDGRMFVSEIRRKIHAEEKIFDKIIFLNMINSFHSRRILQ